MNAVSSLLQRRPYAIALGLAVVLLVGNVVALPNASISYWPGLVGTIAPFVLVALASTPAILGGGIDLSVGPQVVFANVLIAAVLLPAGIDQAWQIVPIVLAVGVAIGTVNGLLVAVLRFPAIIATLCTMFVLIGVNLRLAAQPVSGTTDWISALSGRVGLFPLSLLVILVPFVIWFLLGRTSYLRNLMAAGGDQIAAYSAGVPVSATRVLSYSLGGLFAAIGGLALTSLLRSADASQAGTMILVGLAAVALGGTAFTGGRGGLLGSLLGAICVVLIQNLLTALSVSALWVNVIYGALLIAAVVIGASAQSRRGRRKVA